MKGRCAFIGTSSDVFKAVNVGVFVMNQNRDVNCSTLARRINEFVETAPFRAAVKRAARDPFAVNPQFVMTQRRET